MGKVFHLILLKFPYFSLQNWFQCLCFLGHWSKVFFLFKITYPIATSESLFVRKSPRKGGNRYAVWQRKNISQSRIKSTGKSIRSLWFPEVQKTNASDPKSNFHEIVTNNMNWLFLSIFPSLSYTATNIFLGKSNFLTGLRIIIFGFSIIFINKCMTEWFHSIVYKMKIK